MSASLLNSVVEQAVAADKAYTLNSDIVDTYLMGFEDAYGQQDLTVATLSKDVQLNLDSTEPSLSFNLDLTIANPFETS